MHTMKISYHHGAGGNNINLINKPGEYPDIEGTIYPNYEFDQAFIDEARSRKRRDLRFNPATSTIIKFFPESIEDGSHPFTAAVRFALEVDSEFDRDKIQRLLYNGKVWIGNRLITIEGDNTCSMEYREISCEIRFKLKLPTFIKANNSCKVRTRSVFITLDSFYSSSDIADDIIGILSDIGITTSHLNMYDKNIFDIIQDELFRNAHRTGDEIEISCYEGSHFESVKVIYKNKEEK